MESHFRQACELLCFADLRLEESQDDALGLVGLAIERFRYTMSNKVFLNPRIMPEVVYWYGTGLNMFLQAIKIPIMHNTPIDWERYNLSTESNEMKGRTEADLDRLVYETLAQRMLQLWVTYVELRPDGGKQQDKILDIASEWEAYTWIYF